MRIPPKHAKQSMFSNKKWALTVLAAVMSFYLVFTVAYAIYYKYRSALITSQSGVSLELETDIGIANTTQSDCRIMENGIGWYLKGDTATVTATLNDGYTFDGWYDINGNLVSEELEFEFGMTEYTKLYAYTEMLYAIHSAAEATEINLSEWTAEADAPPATLKVVDSDSAVFNSGVSEKMLFINTTEINAELLQRTDVEIGETYYFTFSLSNTITDTDFTPICRTNGDRNSVDANITQVSAVANGDSTVYTYSYTIPETDSKDYEMTDAAFFGLRFAGACTGYFFDASVYNINDTEAELLPNPDFSFGVLDEWSWGWKWFSYSDIPSYLSEWTNDEGTTTLKVVDFDESLVAAETRQMLHISKPTPDRTEFMNLVDVEVGQTYYFTFALSDSLENKFDVVSRISDGHTAVNSSNIKQVSKVDKIGYSIYTYSYTIPKKANDEKTDVTDYVYFILRFPTICNGYFFDASVYKAGEEDTELLTNADFSNDFNGWTHRDSYNDTQTTLNLVDYNLSILDEFSKNMLYIDVEDPTDETDNEFYQLASVEIGETYYFTFSISSNFNFTPICRANGTREGVDADIRLVSKIDKSGYSIYTYRYTIPQQNILGGDMTNAAFFGIRINRGGDGYFFNASVYKAGDEDTELLKNPDFSTGYLNHWAWNFDIWFAKITEYNDTLDFIRLRTGFTAGDPYSYTDTNGEVVSKIATNIYTGFEEASANYKAPENVPWHSHGSVVKTVTFVDEVKPLSTSHWFNGYSICESIDLKMLNTVDVEYMNNMFYGATSLTELDVSKWDTSSCTNMSFAFFKCSSLETIDVSKWVTSKVTNMNSIFRACTLLDDLDVSEWVTSEATNMANMFYGCNSLSSIDVSKFKTEKVTTFASMFNGCNSLQTVEVSNWNTSSCKNMSSMFSGCTSLQTVDVSKWVTSEATNMGSLFYNCSSLSSIDVSKFKTEKVTTFASMFYNCQALTTIDVSEWVTSSCKNMSSMFNGCNSLQTVEVSNWNTSSCEDMTSMFAGCTKLTTIDVSGWVTDKLTTAASMFYNCQALTTIDVSEWVTDKLTTAASMFHNCFSLTEFSAPKFITASCTNISYMFYSCHVLTTIDVSEWDTSGITNMARTFYACSAITELDLNSWDVSKVTTFNYFLSHSSRLVECNLSNWKVTSECTNFNSMFAYTNITSIDVSGWDTTNVLTFSGMFRYCNNIEEIIGLNDFNTTNGLDFSEMFFGCSKIKELDLSGFDTRKAKYIKTANSTYPITSNSMKDMFKSMTLLERVTLGENFSFVGDGTSDSQYSAVLPTPNSHKITGADGNWYSIATGIAYAAADVPNNNADTYVAIPPTANTEN